MIHANDGQKKTRLHKPKLPVDRGWAWLIMLTAYTNMLMVVAFSRALSILLPEILERYREPAAVTTLAFGLCDLTWSLTNIAMPIVLLPRFSMRSLAFVGGLSHSLCVIALAYSPNITIFNCIFALLGISDGLMLVPSLIHIGHFFKKRLSFASAFTHAGGSTATVVVPLLTRLLLDVYGFQGVLLILGGVSLHCVAASMLLRPLSMYDNTDNDKDLQENTTTNHDPQPSSFDQMQVQSFTSDLNEDDVNEKSKFLEINDDINKQIREISLESNRKVTGYIPVVNGNKHHEMDEGVVETSKFIPKVDSDLTKSTSKISVEKDLEKMLSLLPDAAVQPQTNLDILNTKNTVPLIENDINSHPGISQEENGIENEHKCSPVHECELSSTLPSSELKAVSCEATSFSQILVKVERYSSQVDLIFQPSAETSDKQSCVSDEGNLPSACCCSLRVIKAYFKSSVLSNPVAVMLILAGGFSTPGGNMYLPVLGLENGLTPEEVPWMLTIIGVADIFGKLGIGYFADLGYLRPIRIASITQFTVGTIFQFTMFYKGFGSMAAMATIYGVTANILTVLLTPMIIEMVGLPYLAQITPIYYLATGACTFILNVSVGAIRDSTGSFFGGFNFLGGLILASFTTLLLEPIFVMWRDKYSSYSKNSHKKSAKTSNSKV